jgi:protein-tyrosine phosphatase
VPRGVDLHCHLLPGVDDGPTALDESIAYARAAVAAGTGTIVATPHVELVAVRELPGRVAALRAALAEEGVDLRVEVGGELKPESVGVLDPEELELLAHGPPGRRWLLYEVPFSGVDDAFLDGARELGERGYGLLLAHPERSRGLVTDGGLERIAPLLAGRALLEVNVAPLTGREQPEREAAARHVVERGLAAVVATDAHPPRRPFQLTEARGRIADTAYTTAPATLLAGGI